MIDPAALAHEQCDAGIARRIALLDLPVDDPRRLWEPFSRHLDHPTAPTAALLRHWLDRPVRPVDLLTRRRGERQYRVVSLVTSIGGEQVPLCHASAVVELDLLPKWARDVLTRTEHPLARVMHLVGAVRERAAAVVLDADPDAPGDAGLRIPGAFRLAADGAPIAARVEDWFTSYCVQLHDSSPIPSTDRPDDADRARTRILGRRDALAAAGVRPVPTTTDDPRVPDPRLTAQLVRTLQRGNPPPTPAPGRAERGGAVGRPGA
jgi:hypothetical protein